MTTENEINTIEVQESNDLNLRDILHKYIVQWKWFVVSAAVFFALGYLFVKLTVPLYKIETDLLIKDNKGNFGGQDDLLKDLDLFSSDKIIDNEIAILKSNTIIEKAVKALNLQVSYFIPDGVRQHGVYSNLPYKIQFLRTKPGADLSVMYPVRLVNDAQVEFAGKKYPTNVPIQVSVGEILVTPLPVLNAADKTKPYDVKFSDLRDIVDAYAFGIQVTPVSKQGTVLIITLEDAIPQRGKDVLNRLIYEYNQAAVEDKNKVTSATLTFITDRLNKLQIELSGAEKKVEEFKSSNKIADITSQSQMFLQSVQANDVDRSKVDIQLGILQNLESYLKSANNKPGNLPSMLGIEDPTLLGLVTQLGEAVLRRQSMLQTVPETNPVISSIDDQISTLRSSIDQSVKNLKYNLQLTKKQLDRKSQQFESLITNVPSKERGLLDVMRQREIKNNLFTYLLQKREESEISLASTAADSRTIDEARASRVPVKPVKKATYMLFLLIGLIVPAVIIYLKDVLNYKISKRGDVERATKVPILAEVSHSEDSSPLLVTAKPRSMVAEQLRALRTNLNFVIPKPDQKVILFTSSISGEGKSFISLNLGASLAMSGKKVVILELDLRKPKLHAGLEIENAQGISNYLIGEVTKEQIIKSIPQQSNYFILTSGPIPPNPAELLVNGKIGTLIEELKKDFDYVLLDAPPVGLVTDAQILAEHSDTTLYIVRHNYTAKSQINSIEGFSRSRKFKNLNIVINSIQIQGGYGYGYGYGYSYGYGGYYQEESPKRRSGLGLFKKRKKS